VSISGGATPRRKNSAKPKGGVRNEVCRLTASTTPSQTGLKPKWLTRTGVRMGTWMKQISKKSMKNPRRKMTSITRASTP